MIRPPRLPRPLRGPAGSTLAALLVALFGASLAAEEARAQQGLTGAVSPGDRVSIEVFTGAGSRIPELTGEHRVDREGQIYLPFVGDLGVEGMDATEIRQLLVDELSEFYERPVVVATVELRVNVTGAVTRPGHYFLDPSATILDAVAEAGGMTSRYGFRTGVAADPSAVRLTREDGVRTLDLRAGSADRRTLTLRIQSGDWIHVPETSRSAVRENVQLISSILSVVATIVVLATR